jgi:streptogramin lyase
MRHWFLDGHLFITPSAQRCIIEFDPATKAFGLHEIGGGFYPHTIRVDAKDRVWFTLALSNQIGMLDRATGRFTLYDLPRRGSFMRDVEFAPDGTVYTAISNFPGWQVEGMQPTLIRMQP